MAGKAYIKDRYNFCYVSYFLKAFRDFFSDPSLKATDLNVILYYIYKRLGWRWNYYHDSEGNQIFYKGDLRKLLDDTFYEKMLVDEYNKQVKRKEAKVVQNSVQEPVHEPVQLSLWEQITSEVINEIEKRG